MVEDRFKTGYANWRFNPFTGEDMAVDKTEDNLYIPSSAPFVIQLLEVPRKDTPSSVSVYCYDDGINFTEVSTDPAAGEFRVDYPSPDGHGTGQIEFNSADAGKKVRITYKATGSPIIAEFLDGKISYPQGNPTEGQGVYFKADGTPQYRFITRDYSGELIVVYHSSGEDESAGIIPFKTDSTTTKILLALRGAKIPQWIYTEIGKHKHGAGGLYVPSFRLWVPGHTHPLTLSISPNPHKHTAYAAGGGESQTSEVNLSLSGSVGNSGGQWTAYSGDLAVGGESAETGVSPKTYPNALKIYIDGTDVTSTLQSRMGLSELGDGTDSHVFVTSWHEVDITDLVSGEGFHEIEITEPIQDAGGRVLFHLEIR